MHRWPSIDELTPVDKLARQMFNFASGIYFSQLTRCVMQVGSNTYCVTLVYPIFLKTEV